MAASRNYVLTIAGLDPTNGAGLTADIKTFEQHQVYGLSVCTAITLQTEHQFYTIRWEKIEDVITALKTILANYPVQIIKTGIMPTLDYLDAIVVFLHANYNHIKIIIDPILKSSTGFNFLDQNNKTLFYKILQNCYLITPNINEAQLITGQENELDAAKEIAKYCRVFLKGGHSQKYLGVDYLFANDSYTEFKPTHTDGKSKHGSGCILSAAIAANLCLGFSLQEACEKAKRYIETILQSNTTRLAYHHVS